METTQVLVVGAGQAGLATSYWLTERGTDHVLLERGRTGDSWLDRWDSFCLVTPNWTLNLPGFPYQGEDPDGFILRDQIAEYVLGYRAFLESYCDQRGLNCDALISASLRQVVKLRRQHQKKYGSRGHQLV